MLSSGSGCRSLSLRDTWSGCWDGLRLSQERAAVNRGTVLKRSTTSTTLRLRNYLAIEWANRFKSQCHGKARPVMPPGLNHCTVALHRGTASNSACLFPAIPQQARGADMNAVGVHVRQEQHPPRPLLPFVMIAGKSPTPGSGPDLRIKIGDRRLATLPPPPNRHLGSLRGQRTGQPMLQQHPYLVCLRGMHVAPWDRSRRSIPQSLAPLRCSKSRRQWNSPSCVTWRSN